MCLARDNTGSEAYEGDRDQLGIWGEDAVRDSPRGRVGSSLEDIAIVLVGRHCSDEYGYAGIVYCM